MRHLSPHGPAGSRRPHRGGGWLALAAILMAVAAFLPGTAGLTVLAVAIAALSVAGISNLRAQWRVIQDEGALIAPVADTDTDADSNADTRADTRAADLDLRLRRLHEEHLARVDAALDEGRPEAAHELTDGYLDAALRLLTEGADAGQPRR